MADPGMSCWRIDGIRLPVGTGEEELTAAVASLFNLSPVDVASLHVLRRSVDARRRGRPCLIYAVAASLPDGSVPPVEPPRGITIRTGEEEAPPSFPAIAVLPRRRVCVVGTGPAGLFAALALVRMGIPSLVLERGKAVEERVHDVEAFWEQGLLNPESNVHFGEGGAGTFSDGKLTSRARNPWTGWIKEVLASLGAPPEICVDAKPHIGTDRLRGVVVNLRERLRALGCEVRFGAKVTDFLIRRTGIEGIVVNAAEEITTEHVVLACGQAAVDTYRRLHARGVAVTAKPFAMGVRVEHPQELIDEIQYGRWARHPDLPAAEYALTARVVGGLRSAYTFCMCPGGRVIGCSSREGEVVTNGMSDWRRDGPFANSACVVTVNVDDFGGEGPLGGLAFRRRWEEKAFRAGGADYRAPAEGLTDFLRDTQRSSPRPVSFRPGVRTAPLAPVLPGFVAEALREGFRRFEELMPGFITAEAVLVGVETRTSSPLRILRDADGRSVSTAGLYPCGEGSGYAGGIISSALDGIRAAHRIAASLGNDRR